MNYARSFAGHLCLAFALCVGSLPVPSSAQNTDPPPAIDPRAADIVTDAAEFLARQPRIALDWFVSFDTVIDGREKITQIRSGTNLLSRGEGFYAYVENADKTREFFFDGGAFHIHHVDQNAFAQLPFAGEFEELVDRLQVEYDIALPIWEMMSREGTDNLLTEVESGAYLGEVLIAGQTAHHLAFAQYDQDWQIWISTDAERPVVLMLIGTNPYEQGWPQYRAYFSNWEFDPDFSEDAFTFVPSEDAIQLALPKVQSAAAAELDAILQGTAEGDDQ